MKKISVAVLAAVLIAAFVWLKKPAPTGAHEGARNEPGAAVIAATPRSSLEDASGEDVPNRAGNAGDARGGGAIGSEDGSANAEPPFVFVKGGSVKQSRVVETISEGQGNNLLESLRSQAVSADETMRNARYRELILNQRVWADGRLVNNGLECGKSLCALSAIVNDPQAWQAFRSKALETDDYPIYTVTEVFVEEGQVAEHWLVFSVDPQVNALSVSSTP